MPNSVSWDDFRLVKAIADTGSLVGASDALGLNHSTVFRRLGALEEQLAIKLFERARTGYAPTAAGEEMIRLAQRMDIDITDFQRTVAGRDVKPAGELRITTNDTLLIHLLTPILASFRAAYPDIRLDVNVGNQVLNLSRRDADVAIRATRKPLETLVGRKIATMGWGRFAPRAWVEAGRDLEHETTPWVGFGDTMSHLNAWRWLDEHVGAHRIGYRVNTVLGMAEAVAAGIGLGVLPCFIGDRLPSLARIGMQPGEDVAETLWLLTHADLRQSARVRAFMDHAGREVMKLRPLLEGGPKVAALL